MTTHSLSFSCPPIKGFAGLTVLGNSVQMLCSSRQGGGETRLTGYQTPAAARVVVPACWDHSGWREYWEGGGGEIIREGQPMPVSPGARAAAQPTLPSRLLCADFRPQAGNTHG